MNAKLILAAVVTVLVFSTNAIAEQSFGRGSVYATSGNDSSSPSTAAVNTRPGRDSVYVGDVRAPSAKSAVAHSVTFKPGRA